MNPSENLISFLSSTSVALFFLAFVVAVPGVSPLVAETVQVSSAFALQNAIQQRQEGDVIVIDAGTYSVASLAEPPFRIINRGGITLRAAGGATVILDGGGSSDILRIRNDTPASGGHIVIEGITFADGYSETNAVGSVHVDNSTVTFLGCTFRDHVGNAPNTSSGALHVTNSAVFVQDSIWRDNAAQNSGAGLALQNSTAWVHDSQFLNNRVNLAGHRPTAAGGAVHVGNSTLEITNSRLEGNEAGYTGGGIFMIGDYQEPLNIPRATTRVSNCTFVDNVADRHPSVTLNLPTEGGGFHAENQSIGKIYNSRFLTNRSDIGGAVSLYRAEVEVYDSVFFGNQAVDPGKPTGGAFKANSNDTNNATTGGGVFNRPASRLTVKDSLIQGRYGSVGTVGESGGGIFAAGDNNRTYGLAGVTPMGSAATNRATVVVDGVVFSDLDTQAAAAPRSGKGGGITVNLVDLTLRNSLMIDSDTLGPGDFPQGGALLAIGDSQVAIETSTFADNTAVKGAAINLQGVDLDVTTSQFFGNEISPGIAEPVNQSYGAAVFTSHYVDANVSLDVTGEVRECKMSNNHGLPIYDIDQIASPINAVTYAQNEIASTHFGDQVYRDSIAGAPVNVSGFNTMSVAHTGGAPTIVKTTTPHLSRGSISLGALKTVPRKILPRTAAGDAENTAPVYLAYAWTGGAATLDGIGLGADTSGVLADPLPGTRTLFVDGIEHTAEVVAASPLTASFTATPQTVLPGQAVTLSWTIAGGTFLTMAVDQGVTVTPAASGSVVVHPAATTTYRLFANTAEGGVTAEVTVEIGDPSALLTDGFESGNTSAWF